MKKISFFAVLAVGMLATSCIKEPVSCIETSATAVFIDEKVSFTNCSEDAESFNWTFGDGSAAVTTSAAEYSYTEAGDYTVTLVAYSKKEKKDASSTTKVTVTKSDKQRLSGTKKDGDVVKWTINEVSHHNYVENDPSFDYNDTIPGDGSYIKIFADGTYIAYESNNTPSESGTWSLATDLSTITFTNTSNSTPVVITYTIESFTETSLIYSFDEVFSSGSFVMHNITRTELSR